MVAVFEFFKQEKQNLYRIPDKVKINAITVDLSNFKRQLDNALENQIEEMINLLKLQVKKEAQTIDKFVSEAIERISKKPTNMDQMAVKIK